MKTSINTALSLSIGLILVGTALAAQDFQKGLAAARAGDYATAIQEWTPLAEAGYANAQSNLGYMYENGQGVLQDDVTAHMWYNIGAANGNKLSGIKRDNVAEDMTRQAIEQAQAMARECMSSGYKKCGY